MKKVLMLAIVVLLTLPSLPAQAQGGDTCDTEEVEAWIQQRQTWRQESQGVLDAQGVSAQSALAQLADHLQQIEDLPRPECADEAMLWTYFLYTNLQHLLICAQVGDTSCVAETQGRLTEYRQRDEQLMSALASGSGLPTTVLKPPTPTPAPTSTPAPQVQSLGPIWDELFDETFSVEVGVSNTRFMKSSGYSEAKPGFTYVVVDVLVRNIGPGTLRSLYSNSFQVRDANGALRGDNGFIDAVSACRFDLVDLIAGGTVTGCVGFEVPETGRLEFIYAPYQYEGLQPGRYLSFVIR